jgi:hypothetical protein
MAPTTREIVKTLIVGGKGGGREGGRVYGNLFSSSEIKI